MGTGVLAVALCSQLAIPSIGAIDMGGLALPAKVSALAAMRADILGALAAAAMILRCRGIFCDKRRDRGVRRRGGRGCVCGTREMWGRWYRDWDVHLAFQVLGHDEVRGFWKDLGAGMGVETRKPHLVVSTSKLSLWN
jgi:hypothetical protein